MAGDAALRRSWADTWAAPALVAAAAAAAFARSLPGGFVWDDHQAVEENPHVQHPASWLGLIFDRDSVNQFGFVRPLRTLEFAADRALFGPGPLAFHVHSLLWHLAASVLLLLVLRRLLGDGFAALVGALFWAVHPAQTETVAWIACRADVATAACVFASVLFALRTGGADRDLALSLAAAFVAPFYKETALMLPAAIAALRWTRLSRAPVWPYVAAVAAYLGYRFAMRVPIHAEPFVIGGSVAGTFATMFRGFGFYVAETLVPAQSADWYLSPSTSFADAASLAWLAVHAAVVASAFLARRRAPLWTVSAAWFYAFLLPVSNWPFYVGSPTAERYMYLPLAGAALALGWALTRAARGAWPAAVVVVATLGAASVARCGMWHDEATFWDSVAADHVTGRAEETIGNRLRDEAVGLRARSTATPAGPARDAAEADVRRLLDASLTHYHRMIGAWRAYEGSYDGRRPGTFRAECDASFVCALLGRDAEALFHAEQAVAADESGPEGHFDRAVALRRLGFAPQAVDAMTRARALGRSAPDPRIGSFLFAAAMACQLDAMPSAARRGFAGAVEASPDGAGRLEAASRLAELQAGGVTDVPDAAERARIAESDAALARLPRSCPALDAK